VCIGTGCHLTGDVAGVVVGATGASVRGAGLLVVVLVPVRAGVRALDGERGWRMPMRNHPVHRQR